jgi:hypothetical protein
MAWIDPRYEEHQRKRWTRPDSNRFFKPGCPEAKMPGYLHPWAAVARAEEAKAQEAADWETFQREVLELRRDWEELKREIRAQQAPKAREAEALRIKSDLAFERFVRTYKRYIAQQKAGFNPDQPRVPAGSSEGGRWTSGDGGSTKPQRVRLAGEITGFTKHGINQAITRGVSPSAIHDAVIHPIQILPQPNGTTRYVGGEAVVVLNPLGQVVTIWRK